MRKTGKNKKGPSALGERIRHLEEINRWTLDALDMAVSFGDLHNSSPPDQEPASIFRATRAHLERLISFRLLALFMVDETSSDFVLVDCEPKSGSFMIRKEVDFQISEGVFFLGLISKPGCYGSCKILQEDSSISCLGHTITSGRDGGRDSC